MKREQGLMRANVHLASSGSRGASVQSVESRATLTLVHSAIPDRGGNKPLLPHELEEIDRWSVIAARYVLAGVPVLTAWVCANEWIAAHPDQMPEGIYLDTKHRGAVAACRAHNPKDARSNRAGATSGIGASPPLRASPAPLAAGPDEASTYARGAVASLGVASASAPKAGCRSHHVSSPEPSPSGRRTAIASGKQDTPPTRGPHWIAIMRAKAARYRASADKIDAFLAEYERT